MNVAFELDEDLNRSFRINSFQLRVQHFGQRFAGDQKLDGTKVGRAGKADAITLGDPISVAAVEPDAEFTLVITPLRLEWTANARLGPQ